MFSIQCSEGEEKYGKESVCESKLSDADGEQSETQHWIDTSVDCGYLDARQADELNGELKEIGRMLQTMMDRAEDFKGADYSRVREKPAAYGSINEFFSLL